MSLKQQNDNLGKVGKMISEFSCTGTVRYSTVPDRTVCFLFLVVDIIFWKEITRIDVRTSVLTDFNKYVCTYVRR